MLVLALAWIDSLLHCAFAVLSLLVARRLPVHAGSQRHAWQITGFVFVLFSACHLTQLAFGTTAFVLGAESPVYGTYLTWAPIANHSRTLVAWSLYISLAILTWRGAQVWGVLRYVYAPLAVAMLVLGGMIGWAEGPFNTVRHLTNTSVMDVVGFIAATSLLFAAMLRSSVDRALWVAVFFYAVSSVVSSLFIAALAWVNVENAWSPPPWSMGVSRVIFSSMMVMMAVWRLRLARRGVPLAGLLGTDRVRPPVLA